jgi:hypothetical protein
VAAPCARSLLQLPKPPPFKSEINIAPDLVIDQNDKSLRVNGGSISLFGTKIALPALPFALPATPALNTLSAIYPGARLPHGQSLRWCSKSWLLKALQACTPHSQTGISRLRWAHHAGCCQIRRALQEW